MTTTQGEIMFKFALGLTTGFTLGVIGTGFAAMVAIVALEDSPNLLDALRNNPL
jgi:hypothetical protein